RPCYFLGRIFSSTGDEKLNSNGIDLEGDWDNSDGKRVALNVSQLAEYALFPGQIVVVYGTNTNGAEILARAIYSNAAFPRYLDCRAPRKLLDPFKDTSLQVMIACGPFTHSNSLQFYHSPFHEFANTVIQRRPHVVILVGPFTDRCNELIKTNKVTSTFQEIFESLLLQFVTCLHSAGVIAEIVLIPSPQDIHHSVAYPQPAYHLNVTWIKEEMKYFAQRVHCFSNPCQFFINEVGFGVNSADFLLHCFGAALTKKFEFLFFFFFWWSTSKFNSKQIKKNLLLHLVKTEAIPQKRRAIKLQHRTVFINNGKLLHFHRVFFFFAF
ncbi:DNA directed polymerase, partial [Reticulomyxa filosa]